MFLICLVISSRCLRFSEIQVVNKDAIIAKTIKGKGVSYMENQVGWHGSAPNDELYEQAMSELKAAYAEF